ncbi:hypothetical protein [Microbispora sp. NBC_01389]|uniref:hypothetical protein n=1 Tax=Microbispora sp. NBC_01389 TaxID=2903584 RepID=UPI0032525E7F
MRIVMPLFDRFTPLDAVGPYEVLRFLPDAEIVFAAATPGPVRDVPKWLAVILYGESVRRASGARVEVPRTGGVRGRRSGGADQGLVQVAVGVAAVPLAVKPKVVEPPAAIEPL